MFKHKSHKEVGLNDCVALSIDHISEQANKMFLVYLIFIRLQFLCSIGGRINKFLH